MKDIDERIDRKNFESDEKYEAMLSLLSNAKQEAEKLARDMERAAAAKLQNMREPNPGAWRVTREDDQY